MYMHTTSATVNTKPITSTICLRSHTAVSLKQDLECETETVKSFTSVETMHTLQVR